jgi:hypothetical protein
LVLELERQERGVRTTICPISKSYRSSWIEPPDLCRRERETTAASR